MLVSIAVLGGVAVSVMQQRLAERDARLSGLIHELERRELARLALEAALADLERAVETRDQDLASAATKNESLAVALQQATSERRALEDERNRARERARLLDRDTRAIERWLETAQRERHSVERERAVLEDRLAEAEAARDAAARREAELRSRLQTSQHRLAELEAEHQATARWLAGWIGDRLEAMEAVFERTGIATDRLLEPAAGRGARGQGGPLLPTQRGQSSEVSTFGAEPGHARPRRLSPAVPLAAGMASELDRLEVAERLLLQMPLAKPFEAYHLTSAFGPRVDPLTRRQALHNGLDFGAPAGSEVLATAPGRVTRAGRAGSYGIMVEIDHGHGITTRYAHLSRALVAAGDRLATRAPIGIIGSTGRSTGRHLHYEVLLDGEPRDPARFIAAGRALVAAIGG